MYILRLKETVVHRSKCAWRQKGGTALTLHQVMAVIFYGPTWSASVGKIQSFWAPQSGQYSQKMEHKKVSHIYLTKCLKIRTRFILFEFSTKPNFAFFHTKQLFLKTKSLLHFKYSLQLFNINCVNWGFHLILVNFTIFRFTRAQLYFTKWFFHQSNHSNLPLWCIPQVCWVYHNL